MWITRGADKKYYMLWSGLLAVASTKDRSNIGETRMRINTGSIQRITMCPHGYHHNIESENETIILINSVTETQMMIACRYKEDATRYEHLRLGT